LAGSDRPSDSPFPTGDPDVRKEAVSEAGRACTILLVEDNKSDVFIVREILRREGLNATLRVAADGEQALSFLENGQSPCPDLMILDLNLPKVSGLEVLARMRSTNWCPGTPVIVVTSSQSPSDLAAIRGLNAAAYFQKPTELTAFLELGTVIQRLLVDCKRQRA